MLNEISIIISIIFYLLLIILVIIIIIQTLYPHFSITDYFYPPESIIKETETPDENIPDESQYSSIEDIKPKNYVKYNQNFTIEHVIESNSQDDKVKYRDLIKLIKNLEFIKGYTKSIKLMLEYKLTNYQTQRSKIVEDLKLHRGKTNLNNYDSNLELLLLHEKELNDIISTIEIDMKELNDEKVHRNFRNMIYNSKHGFVSIIGRDDIKDFLAEQIYTFYKNPKVFLNEFPHIRLIGNSGVGKTKLAESMGYIYSKSGILARKRFREYSAKDFTSQFVHEPKRLTFKILLYGLEGLSIIDEAYGIVGTGYNLLHNHGEEVITEIVNFTDKHLGENVIILAGYEKEMNDMMNSNQGLERRFPYVFKINDYTSEQLTEILIKSLKKSDPDLVLDKTDINCIYTYVDMLYNRDKSIFSKQGADMIKLSGNLLKSIYNSKNYDWLPGTENVKVRTYLLHTGFNSYLHSRGLSINI